MILLCRRIHVRRIRIGFTAVSESDQHRPSVNYLHGAKRIVDGARLGRSNKQGLVFLEAVGQQTVDGAVVIVCIRL